MSCFISSSMKVWAFFLSLFYFFSGPAVPPSTDDPIKAPSEDVKLNIVLWADPQVSNYKFERQPHFENACQDINNAETEFDALLAVGDVAENGLLVEYEMIANHIVSDNVKNYIMATGNHDVRMRAYKSTVKRFTAFTNRINEAVGSEMKIDSLSYKTEINGYTFIVLGADRAEFEKSWFSQEQIDWLDESLKEASGSENPVFVLNHQPLQGTHGLPEKWGSSMKFAGSLGKQSDKIFEIMNKYENVVFLTGHLHPGFSEYTYEKVGNIHSVNLPSLTIEGEYGYYTECGMGYIMEAYSDKVVFRARNFSQGRFLPEYDITLNFGE